MNFEELLKHLREDADQATWDIGYMKAVIDEPMVGQKLGDSFSGYALETANAAVKRSLALYCARAWDHDADAISLCNAERLIPSVESLRQIRLTWYPKTSYDAHLINLANQRDEIITRIRLGLQDPKHPALRVFRSERLAHRVTNSRDRQKYVSQSATVDITLSQLVERAEQTVNLVGDLGSVVEGRENSYPDHIEIAHRYSREFWRVLPILRVVEDVV
jgi:hypothetical protein